MSEATAHNPLEQFQVYPLLPLNIGGYDISFTNASLWMALACLGILIFLSVGGRRLALVPGRWQGAAESMVGLIHDMVTENCGREGLRYFPIVFTIFIFVLFSNMFGMLPGGFTVTSHVVVTFALASLVFIGITLIALFRHGPVKFMGYFLPHGTPWWIVPLVYPLEVISFLARPISLSVRLAVNMTAGHILLKVMASFVGIIGLLGIAPFAMVVLLTGFEIGVAILQAYIFTILTCIYLHDALHLH